MVKVTIISTSSSPKHRTDNDYEKPDLPTNQQPVIYTNPAYSAVDDAPLQSAEQPVTADTTYEAIDLEDCQPHLKAQDEETHIYEEISKGGLDGTGHPPDGGELSSQEGNPSTTAEIETSVMWLQRLLYL